MNDQYVALLSEHRAAIDQLEATSKDCDRLNQESEFLRQRSGSCASGSSSSLQVKYVALVEEHRILESGTDCDKI
jgi:hypothetical protein